ncbi:uncharacterized protein BN608_01054 [Firmicutes bacterium CAG:321]|nr:uncharacterized protein BN608_01054 [Firmicutes bacterium CAG:321]
MNLNYAIFRSQQIMTLNDLAQIGSHNKREKQAYKSNPDIKLELKDDNIELVPLESKYVKGFKELTKEYEKEHNERQRTERQEIKKTYSQMLNKSKNVVADELLFTATHNFFENMNKDDIIDWANTCMEFVYKDLGYTKSQVLHATIHLDEETPHLHCVVIPLVKKYDKRTNTERYTISKKQYIRDKYHLSELQDKYHKRLTEKGYDLERGIKGSNAKHQKTKELKKTTRYYENKVKVINTRIDNAMNVFEEKMKTTKNIPFSKTHVLVEKDTFESMNKVIKESKKAIEFQPKLQQLFNEVDNYTKSHQTLEKENEVLNARVNKLSKDNTKLNTRLEAILKVIKEFFRNLLQIGNKLVKETTTIEIKDYYDSKEFNSNDVYDISKGTTKEDELFDYADIPGYYRTRIKSYYHEKDKDDYEISL